MRTEGTHGVHLKEHHVQHVDSDCTHLSRCKKHHQHTKCFTIKTFSTSGAPQLICYTEWKLFVYKEIPELSLVSYLAVVMQTFTSGNPPAAQRSLMLNKFMEWPLSRSLKPITFLFVTACAGGALLCRTWYPELRSWILISSDVRFCY